MTAVTIPTLETERLRLRALNAGDVAAEQAFYATDRSHNVGGPLHPHDVWRYIATHLGHWQLRGFGTFAIEEKATGAFCGHCGPWHPADWPEPEISWTLMAQAEGRGIALEAARATRDWAYGTLGWRTAISLIAPDNTRSAALAARLGATREGTYRHHRFGMMDVWRHPSPESGQ